MQRFKKLGCILLSLIMLCLFTSCSIVKKGEGGGNGDSGESGGGVTATAQRHAVPDGIESNAVNIIRDDMFQCGINVLGINASDGGRNLYGYFDYDGRALFTGQDLFPVPGGSNHRDSRQRNRAWELTQWASKKNIVDDCIKNVDGDTYSYENEYKKIVVNPVTGTITIRSNCGMEYGYKERADKDSWVHFLLEQFPTKRTLGSFTKAYLYCDFCVNECTNRLTIGDASGIGEDAQAAQLVWYFRFSASDLTRIWLGIPLYDNREEGKMVPGGAFTYDEGTKSAIYTVAKDDFFKTQPVKGTRYRVMSQIDAELRFAYEQTVAVGTFDSSLDINEAYLDTMNIGFEIPGTFDFEVTFYQIGLYVV